MSPPQNAPDPTTAALDRARAVADAVLYEGYLLYPYRATSSKNQARWQFGVLGPPGAAEAFVGEDATVATQLLVRGGEHTTVSARLRFLQLQARTAHAATDDGRFTDTDELVVGEQRWLTWDEAVECEPEPLTWPLRELLAEPRQRVIDIAGGVDVEDVVAADGSVAGQLVRTRHALQATIHAHAERAGDAIRLHLRVENTTSGSAPRPNAAIADSLIGAHVLLSVDGGAFASMTDPPADLAGAAATSEQHRCWPVLAGAEGDTSLMLVSPIILYDHPQIAEQSQGALFDATEIDEILTLRIMTMTDEEKAAARATDARAAEIIDRCDAMSPDDLAQLHGILRDPHVDAVPAPFDADGFDAEAFDADAFLAGPPDAFGNDLSGTLGFDGAVPWWDPAVDGSVDPSTDSVTVRGVVVRAGSIVRVEPNRRADAQDIFFAGRLARVTAVHTDVDGDTHVAVVLLDDPAAELHDWYGRYLHFAPDEIVPVDPESDHDNAETPTPAPPAAQSDRQESRS